MGQQIFDSSEFEDTINIVYIYIFFLNIPFVYENQLYCRSMSVILHFTGSEKTNLISAVSQAVPETYPMLKYPQVIF